ncbi:MAG TPA: hypothetical protein PLN52_20855 [Opitutaceae bacterium]|nr:hypothetical protein [Opitutaceae bacterium]
MTPPPDSSSNLSWEDKIRSARSDIPPQINLECIVATVHRDPTPSSLGWVEDFSSLFGAQRILAIGSFACLSLLLLTSWEVAELLPSLSWAEIISFELGGRL